MLKAVLRVAILVLLATVVFNLTNSNFLKGSLTSKYSRHFGLNRECKEVVLHKMGLMRGKVDQPENYSWTKGISHYYKDTVVRYYNQVKTYTLYSLSFLVYLIKNVCLFVQDVKAYTCK